MASSKSCHIPGSMRQGLSLLTPNLEGSESKARKTMEGKLEVSTKPFSYRIRGENYPRLCAEKLQCVKVELRKMIKDFSSKGNPELQYGGQEECLKEEGCSVQEKVTYSEDWEMPLWLSWERLSWHSISGSNFKLENSFIFCHWGHFYNRCSGCFENSARS